MATSSINIRMDSELKKQFDSICNDMGLNMTTAFNVFAKAVVQRRCIPFTVSAGDPFYCENNMKALDESIEQVRAGKVVVKTIEELEAMENE